MTDEKKGEATFNIGGAVSGGAYSAGVFDFLTEALNEWQKQKDDPNANVPRHDVFISAVSGTSAGGITAALGLASLAAGIRSVEEPSVNPASPPIRRVLARRSSRSPPAGRSAPRRRSLPCHGGDAVQNA